MSERPERATDAEFAAIQEKVNDPGTTSISQRMARVLVGWLVAEREVAADTGPSLDVRRVVQAVTNVAARHGIHRDPPVETSVARIWGYSAALPSMDAEIADEYRRLASSATPENREEPE